MAASMRSFSIATLAVLAAAGAAAAHSGGNANVRAELGRLPWALSGMRVEVHETIGPQLVIENTTRRTLEVLDDAGVPFLRIGPKGVEGNVAARAWYLTYSPGAVVPASAGRGDAARWIRVSTEPTFGWFEPRLDAMHIDVPREVSASARATEVGRWKVPLRVNGVHVVLSGPFRYEPPPAGAYTSHLTSPPEIAPGVHVMLLPGRVPGLLVQSSSARPLVVFGAGGEPFLRVGRYGVEANVRSSTWWQSARSGSRRVATTGASAAPEWQLVAQAPRFSWIEPRAAYPDHARPATGGSGDVLQWQVPMQLGDDDPVLVTGVVTWKPASQIR